MTDLILDDPKNRNSVGIEIAKAFENESGEVSIISPYVSEVDDFLPKLKLSPLRLLCNARSNSCNPNTIKSLSERDGVEVRSRSDIHAKAYFSKNVAVLGSANASKNGLGEGTLEAAVKITEKKKIIELRNWFDLLWNHDGTEKVADFDKWVWKKLEAGWNNQGPRRKLPRLGEALLSKSVPDNVSFVFFTEGIDVEVPTKEELIQSFDEEFDLEKPDLESEWDFWVEDEYNKKEFQKLEKIREKYRDQTFVCLRIDDYVPSTSFYASGEAFTSMMFYKPVIHEDKNDDKYIYTFYRLARTILKVEKGCIELLNESLKRNPKKWENFFKTPHGEYGYCTREQLYDLIDWS